MEETKNHKKSPIPDKTMKRLDHCSAISDQALAHILQTKFVLTYSDGIIYYVLIWRFLIVFLLSISSLVS